MEKGNIILRKIWQDSELIELAAECTSPLITARSKIYVSADLIDELVQKIRTFLGGQCNETQWANEARGSGSTVCLSLRFLKKDTLGHILIEVFTEVEDGGDRETHNCCFYVHTECGLLRQFCYELLSLKDCAAGREVHLNPF